MSLDVSFSYNETASASAVTPIALVLGNGEAIPIAMKVITRHAGWYNILPHKAVIPPNTTCTVSVFLKPPEGINDVLSAVDAHDAVREKRNKDSPSSTVVGTTDLRGDNNNNESLPLASGVSSPMLGRARSSSSSSMQQPSSSLSSSPVIRQPEADLLRVELRMMTVLTSKSPSQLLNLTSSEFDKYWADGIPQTPIEVPVKLCHLTAVEYVDQMSKRQLAFTLAKEQELLDLKQQIASIQQVAAQLNARRESYDAEAEARREALTTTLASSSVDRQGLVPASLHVAWTIIGCLAAFQLANPGGIEKLWHSFL